MKRSPNYNDREGVAVDMLVMHYTGMRSAEEALDRLCDPAAKVSAHYVIEEDGTIHTLVDEEHRAWHAGVASWRGADNINSRSVGIELVNPGHEFGYRAFPKSQVSAAIDLCHGILARHDIPARNVVGHSDVAPSRKEDPGELFPWRALATQGIGLWPSANADAPIVDQHDVERTLQGVGYDINDLPAAIKAFQRHFCPAHMDGTANDATRRSLAAVVAML